jgi:hypothetical protein
LPHVQRAERGRGATTQHQASAGAGSGTVGLHPHPLHPRPPGLPRSLRIVRLLFQLPQSRGSRGLAHH